MHMLLDYTSNPSAFELTPAVLIKELACTERHACPAGTDPCTAGWKNISWSSHARA
jgi:hypothetical protein